MNDKKTKLMWVGIAVLAGMIAYPPWVSKWTWGRSSHQITYTTCYAPLWEDNVGERMQTNIRSSALTYSKIDVPKLLLQLGTVVLITGGLMVTNRTKPQAQGGTDGLQQAGYSAGPKPPTAAANDEASNGDVS